MKTKFFTLFVALVCATSAFAHDFEVGGIYYNKLFGGAVEVTFKGDYATTWDEYSGNITIPEKVTYQSITYRVTSIYDFAFSHCPSLTEVTIPNSVTSISKGAFKNCSSLTKVTIGNSVTTIGDDAFLYCSSLLEVTIPNSVITIGDNAFSNCSSLETITVETGNQTFHSSGNCIIETATKILHIGCKNSTIPIDGSVTTIGDNAFSGCSSLTEITIPNSVTSIGTSAFYNCSSLTEVTIPNSVTSIGTSAFYNCSNLTKVIIPDGVTSIGSSAFWDCSSLTSITIPNSVTAIDYSTFYGCSSLTEVTIGESVTSIGSWAFYGCSSLQSVKIEAINPPTGNGDISTSCKISVPCSALEAYQQHSDWRRYTLQGYLAVEYSVSVTSENTTQGTAVVTQEPSCDSDIATIQATPQAGYRFVAWNDGNTDNPRSITVTQDTTFTATFAVVNVSAITLSKTTLQLPIGDTHQLVATVVPDNALNKNVTWSSSNAEVVSVVNGLVTAVADGTATITATTEDGGYTATCEVTVTTPVSSISLDKTSLDLIVGETEQLTATIEPTNASNQNITWSSSNNNVATVANGLVTAVSNGTATITATAEDGGFTATCEVIVVGDSNPNSEGITVRFKKPDDWSGVYLYAWNWNEEHTVVTEYLGSWPGTQLTGPDAQGWYSYTFDKTLTSVNFIFNNGGNGVQTADLFTTQSVCYEWDGTAAVLVDCPEGTAVENVPADGVSSVRKVLENGTI